LEGRGEVFRSLDRRAANTVVLVRQQRSQQFRQAGAGPPPDQAEIISLADMIYRERLGGC
jgi:hypothetical protein